MKIQIDNLENQKVIDLLHAHLESMADTAPPESRHALDLNGLRSPGVTFWTIWEDDELAGFGALKHLTNDHVEIKSMRTASSHLRKGVGSNILRHLLQEAKRRGYSRVSLETGSMDYFKPARKFYESHGFVQCEPFDKYKPDPNSVFMTRII